MRRDELIKRRKAKQRHRRNLHAKLSVRRLIAAMKAARKNQAAELQT